VRLFITGISGLLGLNLALQVKDRFTVFGSYYSHPVSLPGTTTMSLDTTDLQAVGGLMRALRPDVVVHTVALTDVEQCEANPDLAHRLNELAAQHVARKSAGLGARLVHISTDHLFDGTRPWTTETDPPSPVNTYAKTKWLGEQAVLEACPDALIIRTRDCISFSQLHPLCFCPDANSRSGQALEGTSPHVNGQNMECGSRPSICF